MNKTTDIAIIGAGPYGLSLAAHLADAGIEFRIFGSPMSFWRTCMPEGMVLKSEGFASTLWEPRGVHTLKRYCSENGLAYQDSGLPVPLTTFYDYGLSFQRALVPNLDQRQVTRLDLDQDGYRLRLSDGEPISARRVVLATGIGHFPHIPPELSAIEGPLLSHSTALTSPGSFKGKDVLVIGGGASGVELAGLLSARGACVTNAVRADRIAFCGPPVPRTILERLRAPESGLGTGWRSLACVTGPLLFHALPQSFRHLIVRKHLGPAPGWTSRTEVERNVSVILGATPAASGFQGDKPFVDFRLKDGTQTRVAAEHVVAATGFRVDLRRLPFISPELMGRVRLEEATPALSRHFETSVPGLFVVGALAANSFGPLLRFAYGAGFTSHHLATYLRRVVSRQRRSTQAMEVPA